MGFLRFQKLSLWMRCIYIYLAIYLYLPIHPSIYLVILYIYLVIFLLVCHCTAKRAKDKQKGTTPCGKIAISIIYSVGFLPQKRINIFIGPHYQFSTHIAERPNVPQKHQQRDPQTPSSTPRSTKPRHMKACHDHLGKVWDRFVTRLGGQEVSLIHMYITNQNVFVTRFH